MNEIVCSKEEIKEICQRIGKELTNKFKDNAIPPLFIGVLKGSLPFMMDLIKEVNCDIELDFVQYSSYIKTKSSGVVVLKKDIEKDITNRDVVVIEDIIDTGRTLDKFHNYLLSRSPKSITTVVLLDKKSKREVETPVDYVGKEIEDKFVVGYGLDYQEYLRNIDHVFVIDEETLQRIDKESK